MIHTKQNQNDSTKFNVDLSHLVRLKFLTKLRIVRVIWRRTNMAKQQDGIICKKLVLSSGI
jgi:hypothetical protein